MDFFSFESFGQFIEKYGVATGIIVLLIVMAMYQNISFSKRIQGLTMAITMLTEKVSTPYLDVQHSLILYRSVMKAAIIMQLRFLGEVLRVNNIQSRKEKIKENIRLEFQRINSEQSSKLSVFKSVCGDMGKYILDRTNNDQYLESINTIFFGDDTDSLKMQDINRFLENHYETIAGEIETNGIHN